MVRNGNKTWILRLCHVHDVVDDTPLVPRAAQCSGLIKHTPILRECKPIVDCGASRDVCHHSGKIDVHVLACRDFMKGSTVRDVGMHATKPRNVGPWKRGLYKVAV